MSGEDALGELNDGTPLARFVVQSNLIRAKQTPRVKPRVFLPRPEAGEGAFSLSTFRLDGLSDNEIVAFGRSWAATHHGNEERLKASCHLDAQDYEAARLCLNPDNVPHRHVNVGCWPVDDADQLEIANELCRLVEERGTLREYR